MNRVVYTKADLKKLGIQWCKVDMYTKMRDGMFPKCFYLGRKTQGWWASDIVEWLADKTDSTPSQVRQRIAKEGGEVEA